MVWQGDCVMVEEGVVVGPLYTRTVPVCLECLRTGPSLAPCPRCGWPLCASGEARKSSRRYNIVHVQHLHKEGLKQIIVH